MSRLQSEWQRLYGATAATESDASLQDIDLVDAQGRVRALVLSLARPADWAALSTVWQAVQADLGLPAPGISVSGVDACQLWFSLAEPVPVEEAHSFLEALRRQHLGHVPPARIGLLPLADAQASTAAWQAMSRPGQEARPGQWAAFVAPDLVPMFADTPWLDLPPSPEGQAELLAALHRITPAAWQLAVQRLQGAQAAPAGMAPAAASAPSSAPWAAAESEPDPHRFLRQVMRDEAVPLALRIEAAKALLPYSHRPA